MKNTGIGILLLFVILSCASCSSYFERRDTITGYLVQSSVLNIRAADSTDSEIVARASLGDTLLRAKPRQYTHRLNGKPTQWQTVTYKGVYGYVHRKYIKEQRVPNPSRVKHLTLEPKQSFFRDLFIKYVQWHTKIFWIIAFCLIPLVILIWFLGQVLDGYLEDWNYGFDFGQTLFPFVTGILGALFSMVYLVWPERVLRALFVSKLWLLPEAESWISWYLWALSALGFLALVISCLKSLYNFRIRGVLRILYSTIAAAIFFVAGLYLSVLFLVLMIVFGGPDLGQVDFSNMFPERSSSGRRESGRRQREEDEFHKRSRKLHDESMERERLNRAREEFERKSGYMD